MGIFKENPGLLPATVAGGTGALGSIASLINTNKTIKANRELAEYSYSKDLEMWNRGNLYNSPTEQMKRLKEANLNPNLVYGSGSVAGNTTGSLPKYNAPTQRYDYQFPDFTNMIGAYQDFKVKQAQTELLQSQKKAVDASAGLNTLKGNLLNATMEDQVGAWTAKSSFLWDTYNDRTDLMRNRKLSEWERQAGMEQARKWKESLQPYQLQSWQNKNKMESRQLDAILANTAFTRAKTKSEGLNQREKLINLLTLGERQLVELQNLYRTGNKLKLGNEYQEMENKYYIEKLAGEFIGQALGMLPKFIGSFRKGK